MSNRDVESSSVSVRERGRLPVRTEWLAVALAIGAAAFLFATTALGRGLLNVQSESTAMLRSVAGAWMCACFVVLSLWQRERNGTDTRVHRRFLPFILLATTVASLLGLAAVAFG
jgi:hypothetical protein